MLADARHDTLSGPRGGRSSQGVPVRARGVHLIGRVDNLLRPMRVRHNTRMPDYVVMITTSGGVVVFGINGFILDPLIGAMFIAVWHIHSTTQHGSSPSQIATWTGR